MNKIFERALRIAGAILAGFLTGYIAVIIFELIDMSNHNHHAGDIDYRFDMPILLSAILGSLLAGIIAAVASYRITIINTAITGMVLTIIWLRINHFNFNSDYANTIAEKICIYIILPLTIVGGLLATKYKLRKRPAS